MSKAKKADRHEFWELTKELDAIRGRISDYLLRHPDGHSCRSCRELRQHRPHFPGYRDTLAAVGTLLSALDIEFYTVDAPSAEELAIVIGLPPIVEGGAS